MDNAIFHTAQINSGNSGGPLFLPNTGEVIGVNYAGSTEQNAHIAISAKEARSVVAQLIEGKDKNAIGISGEVVALANPNDPTQILVTGVWVSAVKPGGYADQAGLKPGDLIKDFGGLAMHDPNDPDNRTLRHYCNVLKSNNPADGPIQIEVYRADGDAFCDGQVGQGGRALTVKGSQTACPQSANNGGNAGGNNGGDNGGNNGGNAGGNNGGNAGGNNGGNNGGNADTPAQQYAQKLRGCGLLTAGLVVEAPTFPLDCVLECLAGKTCEELRQDTCTADDAITESCRDQCDEQATCDNGDQISALDVCDGIKDCADNSDEAGCLMFTCQSGQTVPLIFQCDGDPDCDDGSDEQGCSTPICD